MNYNELINYLFTIADTKFAAFSKTISNSEYLVMGIKNPVLRQIIKDNINNNELRTTDFIIGKYLEVDFIYFGLSLSRLKTVEEQLDFIINNIKYAKSWVITDCITTFIKKTTYIEFYDKFIKLYNTEYLYERRMAYVLALKQYKNKDILNILPLIRLNEEYMVMMSEAWLLSVMAICYEDEIYNYLANCSDLTLKRKTISKICDSFRFSKESKEHFKELR